ncbi:MAG TPA: response regulator [Bauldia sp.]|nr:response regulator [Bauldia sp.]
MSEGMILIVDDSLTVRMDLAEAFEATGFKTLPCGTLGEARAALAAETIALAVLDVLLPDGDGIDFLAELRANPDTAAIPVLMLSSEAEVKDRVRGLKTGADEYVGKPYDDKYVVAKARELLRTRQTQSGDQQTVMVVDDSLTYRQTLAEAIAGDGYAVLLAGSGEEALRMLALRRPDAIVVDGVLPEMDGATLIRRVRLDAALRGLPCLLLTASHERGVELRALEAGADAFVQKDEDVSVVLAKLKAAMRGAATARPMDDLATLLGPHKILAVDDSATYLNELAEALRGEGYDVVSARSGEEALELLAVQQVGCILLDLLMPGIGGTETCRRIKNAPFLRDIPLIMLTAMEDRSAMLEGLSAGADDYISKSSEFDVLKARVRVQIRRKQFEDENRRIREELLSKELEAADERAARELAEARAELVAELERKNKELEAFSYSVSHDLRTPLRAIDGFSQALLEDYPDKIDPTGQNYLKRIRGAAQRMGELIDDMLQLSQVSRAEINAQPVDLSALAREIAAGLSSGGRKVTVRIEDGLMTTADRRLMKIVMENLMGNAWKFTGKADDPRVEVGKTEARQGEAFYIRDNGAGFDMALADKMFQPFRRLHSEAEFPGTGVGLATIHRVIDRHGGRVWAEGKVGEGATFFFTLAA